MRRKQKIQKVLKEQRRAQALDRDEHRARDVLASTGLREERVERIVTATDRLVRRHLAIRLDTFDDDAGAPERGQPFLPAEPYTIFVAARPVADALIALHTSSTPTSSAHRTERKARCTVLEAEQLPARVPNLRARLAHVDEDRLTHCAWLSATLR